MRTCCQCRRHVFATEPACPFCGGPLPLSEGPRGIGVALGLALASCGPGRAVDGETAAATGSTSSGPMPPWSTSDGADGADAGEADGTNGLATSGASVGDESDDDCGGCCGGFYGGCPPDFGGSPFECDLILQDCDDGAKCMPWANDGGPAWNATRCSPLADDPVPPGGACMVEGSAVSGVDDCDGASMCWSVGEDGVGYCEDFCTGSADDPVCESPEDICYIGNDGALVLCLPSCDPLLQDCAGADACHEANDDWACFPNSSGGVALPGTPCTWSPECNAGLVCLGSDLVADCVGEIGCCAPLCDLTVADPGAVCTAVDPTATCEPWYVPQLAPPELAHVGVCVTGEDDTTGG